MISTIENIQTRLSEIEYVFLPTIRNDSEMNKESISEILQFKEQFDKVCSQIDNLDSLVYRVKSDLIKIEDQMDIADEELDLSNRNSLNFLKSLNPFVKTRNPQKTNVGESSGRYDPIDVFHASEYFDEKND